MTHQEAVNNLLEKFESQHIRADYVEGEGISLTFIFDSLACAFMSESDIEEYREGVEIEEA